MDLKNKRGDIESLIYVVAILFAIGFVVVLGNMFTHAFYTQTESIFNSTASLNNSEAIPAIQKIRDVDDTAWDYAILGIYVAILGGMAFTSYLTRISLIFFWIYGVMALVVLAIGVMLSNAWQTMMAKPELTETIARFPITNVLLGSYGTIAVTAIIMVTILFLFAKTPDNSGGITQ